MSIKKCNGCGNTRFRFLYTLTSSTFGKAEKKFHMVKCRKCGLIFIKNPPTPKELDEMYSNEYFDRTEHNFDIERFENRVSKWNIRRHNKLLKKIESYSQIGHMLDIGPGLGSFLNEAKNRGWIVHGIEPSKTMAKYCREKLKINIQECFLEEAKYKNSFFDAINMDNVFEHVRDPMKTLTIIRRWLKKEGVLVIEVPNEGGIVYTAVRVYKRGRELFGMKNEEKLLQHLFYYDIRSITQLLKSAGFKVVKHYTRETLPTKGLSPVMSIIQRILLMMSKFSRKRGDILTVFAKKV